jgi:hypothetical protein
MFSVQWDYRRGMKRSWLISRCYPGIRRTKKGYENACTHTHTHTYASIYWCEMQSALSLCSFAVTETVNSAHVKWSFRVSETVSSSWKLILPDIVTDLTDGKFTLRDPLWIIIHYYESLLSFILIYFFFIPFYLLFPSLPNSPFPGTYLGSYYPLGNNVN